MLLGSYLYTSLISGLNEIWCWQWRKIIARVEQLSIVLNKPDLWDDPTFAGRVNREHGELMSKIKEVNWFEQELLEHIDMLKLAREENDEELESVRSCL